jgi:Uma2 family endonuclease
MATVPSVPVEEEVEYPTSDGRPMAETDAHRDNMADLIEMLKTWYAGLPRVCVSGNLLVFYVRGDKRKHVSPDVFVVRGVAKRRRDHYLVWEEKKGPEVAIEITTGSTRKEDLKEKFVLYRDVLQVQEYFLFDPYAEYLKPPLQGFHLVRGRYVRIRPVAGRLPSAILELHLERDGEQLRLYNPQTGQWLLTGRERSAQAEAEVERLRRQLEALRRRTSDKP